MSETAKTTGGKNMHAIILAVIGLIAVIAGGAIVAIPGAPLRGSGAGTLLIVLGLVLFFIAYLRFTRKRA
ncbi:MAG TPA: hypothetical protein VKF39_04425 [Nitrososphaerales archaeon]|nr:hypothetical protein [Nitrososphaerales archaeon]